MNNNEKFVFNYSAKQQKEVEQIREKYMPRKENKLDAIRKLDEGVGVKATTITIIIGIISSLILGVGMCCTMVWQDTMFLPGVVIGIIGLLGIGITYPVYNCIIKKERSKIAEQIIKLSNEFESEHLIKKSASDKNE